MIYRDRYAILLYYCYCRVRGLARSVCIESLETIFIGIILYCYVYKRHVVYAHIVIYIIITLLFANGAV